MRDRSFDAYNMRELTNLSPKKSDIVVQATEANEVLVEKDVS